MGRHDWSAASSSYIGDLVYSFARAAVTEHHSLDVLTAEIKWVASGGSEVPDLGVVWVGLCETSLLRLQAVPLTVASQLFFSANGRAGDLWCSPPSHMRTPIPWHWAPPL